MPHLLAWAASLGVLPEALGHSRELLMGQAAHRGYRPSSSLEFQPPSFSPKKGYRFPCPVWVQFTNSVMVALGPGPALLGVPSSQDPTSPVGTGPTCQVSSKPLLPRVDSQKGPVTAPPPGAFWPLPAVTSPFCLRPLDILISCNNKEARLHSPHSRHPSPCALSPSLLRSC